VEQIATAPGQIDSFKRRKAGNTAKNDKKMAQSAKNKSNNAKNKSNNAKNKSNNAKNKSNNAKSKSNNAKNKFNNAKSSDKKKDNPKRLSYVILSKKNLIYRWR
jgi:hypothetical protein